MAWDPEPGSWRGIRAVELSPPVEALVPGGDVIQLSTAQALSLRPKTAVNTGEVSDAGLGFYYFGQVSDLGKRLAWLDYNPELRGQHAYDLFERMRLGDPKIYGLRKALDMPIVRSSVTIEPADPTSDVCKKVARDFEQDLMDHMGTSWRTFLENACLAADYGFSCFEIVWGVDKAGSGHVFIDRLSWRTQRSIWQIYVQDDRVSGVQQWRSDGSDVYIPGEKLLWFTYGRDGDNFRGRSLMRPLYKPWYNKEKSEIEMLLLMEKMGGVPTAKEQIALDTKTRADIDYALEQFRISERMGIRMPPQVDFKMESANIRLAEALQVVKYWDQQLSTACLGQVLDISEANGGRGAAIGTIYGDLLNESIQARAAHYEDTFNADGGLVHQWTAYNYPNAEEVRPKLRFGRINRIDIVMAAQGLNLLVMCGLITPTPDLEDFIRNEIDFPVGDVAQRVALKTVPGSATQPAPGQPDPITPAATPEPGDMQGDPNKTGATTADVTHGEGALLLASGSYTKRAPRGKELYVDLADLDAQLEAAKRAVLEATADTRASLAAELLKRATAAQQAGKAAAFAASAPPQLDVLAREIKTAMTSYYQAGRAQVASELDRQRLGQPVIADEMDERRGTDAGLTMADRPLVGPLPLPLPAPAPENDDEASLAYIDDQAQVLARMIGAALLTGAARHVLSISVTAETMAAAEDALDQTSDAVALSAGGTIGRVMALGRSDQAAAQRDVISEAEYSTILDSTTCDECEAMDGTITTDLDEAAGWVPNPDCAGGEACRCAVFYSYAEAA